MCASVQSRRLRASNGRTPGRTTRRAVSGSPNKRRSCSRPSVKRFDSLARFFLAIDANYLQLQTAKRLRIAAADRLDAQRAYYEEGRITIDRFLHSVSLYATAVGTEAQYRATYNTSIVALKEAKGTLLADYNIVVADAKQPRKDVAARQPKADEAAKPTAFMDPVKSDACADASARADRPRTRGQLRYRTAQIEEGYLPGRVRDCNQNLDVFTHGRFGTQPGSDQGDDFGRRPRQDQPVGRR